MNGNALLLVDDDDSNRLTLSALLEDEGFQVDVARSAAEARSRLEGGACDGVLLDQNLGDGLGSDLIPLIRQRWPRARVLMLSGDTPEIARLADACLVKGSEFPVLIS